MIEFEHEPTKCSVGITAHNEEANIAHILEAMFGTGWVDGLDEGGCHGDTVEYCRVEPYKTREGETILTGDCVGRQTLREPYESAMRSGKYRK